MPALSSLSWPLQTERLTIRPVRLDDVPAIFDYRRLPEVGQWMTAQPVALETFSESFPTETRMGNTLVIEYDGRVVGDLYVRVEDAWGQAEVADLVKDAQAEIGWCLEPSAQGVGLATEACRALLAVCFADSPAGLGLRRVYANCFAGNERSWRLMERIGMRREVYTLKESLHRSGEWLDGMSYGLLAEEWRTGATAPALDPTLEEALRP